MLTGVVYAIVAAQLMKMIYVSSAHQATDTVDIASASSLYHDYGSLHFYQLVPLGGGRLLGAWGPGLAGREAARRRSLGGACRWPSLAPRPAQAGARRGARRRHGTAGEASQLALALRYLRDGRNPS